MIDGNDDDDIFIKLYDDDNRFENCDDDILDCNADDVYRII